MSDYVGADLNQLLLRHAALSLVLQGLLDLMLSKSLIELDEVLQIKAYALDLSQDMINIGDAHIRAAGIRIGEEIEAYLQVVTGKVC